MCPDRSRGVTLVELIVFIVIVGVAMAGLFAAFNTITAASADPQVRKQVLAIAESLMEEIQLMPFTYCDPNDTNATTATSTGTCAVASNNEDLAMGVEAGETRGHASNPFNNVSDYHGLSMTPGTGGIKDITGTPISGLEQYSASVTVSRAGTALGLGADERALMISVVVSHPNGTSITLEGYRTRYAPNTLP